MTRKENLLVEIYNLRNQISEIMGNKQVNIEEFSQTRKFLADELTAEFKRLSPEYTRLMERTAEINKEHRALLEQRLALKE